MKRSYTGQNKTQTDIVRRRGTEKASSTVIGQLTDDVMHQRPLVIKSV